MSDLYRWQLYRDLLRFVAYVCVALLLVSGLAGYFGIDLGEATAAFLYHRVIIPLGPRGLARRASVKPKNFNV